MTDTERIDKLQELEEGNKWVLRDSTTGRGLRLHITSLEEGNVSIREAIDTYLSNI